MRIQFCDLCNESVPEGDFAAGRAFMRQGRIICATCESSMSQVEKDDVQKGPLALTNLPGQSAPVSVVSGSLQGWQSSSVSGWIGVLALLFAAVSAWFVSGELSSLRDGDLQLRTSVDNELNLVASNLDNLSLRARVDDEGLEGRLRAGFNVRQSETETRIDTLREDLRAAREHLQKIDGELARLGEDQQDSDQQHGRRIDDLLAQSMKSRQVLDGLMTRLGKTEVALAANNARTAQPVQPPRGARYAAEIADLLSPSAGTRWNAVQSLGETGDQDVVPYLLPLLQDSDVFVRMAVARVCGDLASPLAVDVLIDALEDEEPVVREAAMAALHIITGRDFNFDPNAKSVERSKRIKSWREWWGKAKAGFIGDL